MPYEITLCLGNDCPLKNDCLRSTAKRYGRQNFFEKPPYKKESDSCEHFIDNRPADEQIAVKAYFLWQQSGCPSENDIDFWLEAKQQLIERKNETL